MYVFLIISTKHKLFSKNICNSANSYTFSRIKSGIVLQVFVWQIQLRTLYIFNFSRNLCKTITLFFILLLTKNYKSRKPLVLIDLKPWYEKFKINNDSPKTKELSYTLYSFAVVNYYFILLISN